MPDPTIWLFRHFYFYTFLLYLLNGNETPIRNRVCVLCSHDLGSHFAVRDSFIVILDDKGPDGRFDPICTKHDVSFRLCTIRKVDLDFLGTGISLWNADTDAPLVEVRPGVVNKMYESFKESRPINA